MADIVVNTTNVHDVAASIFGLWQCFEELGEHGADLLEQLKVALRPNDTEFVPTVTQEDSVLMLASYDVWEKTFPPPDESSNISGVGKPTQLRKLLTQQSARKIVATPERQAVNRAIITAALRDNDDNDDDDDDDANPTPDQVGFLGLAIRGACLGASILFRRVGGKVALRVVATFARAGARRLVSLARSVATKAIATKATKYLLVAGAISIGEKFVVSTAKNIASGATAVGKSALWLLAAYAAYTFLADKRR